jgi:hypothetical protein
MKMYEGGPVWIHVFSTLPLLGGEWSFILQPLYPRRKSSRFPFSRGLGDPRMGLDDLKRGKNLSSTWT